MEERLGAAAVKTARVLTVFAPEGYTVTKTQHQGLIDSSCGKYIIDEHPGLHKISLSVKELVRTGDKFWRWRLENWN